MSMQLNESKLHLRLFTPHFLYQNFTQGYARKVTFTQYVCFIIFTPATPFDRTANWKISDDDKTAVTTTSGIFVLIFIETIRYEGEYLVG